MALQIKNDSQAFSPRRGSGPNSTIKNVTMPAAVTQATAILTGFIAEFSHGDDHHIGQLDVQVQVASAPAGTTVPVRITYGLRDWSGDWDDDFDGTVFFAVVGE